MGTTVLLYASKWLLASSLQTLRGIEEDVSHVRERQKEGEGGRQREVRRAEIFMIPCTLANPDNMVFLWLLTFLREVGLPACCDLGCDWMADDFLGDHPKLKPYVLSDVQLTGTTIGHGAYGSVEEVAVPVCGAAKKVHDLLLGTGAVLCACACQGRSTHSGRSGRIFFLEPLYT